MKMRSLDIPDLGRAKQHCSMNKNEWRRHAVSTAPNKRLCGKIAHPLGLSVLKAIAILPKFYSVSYGASGKRLRHRPRPVSCRLFPVTARKILLAGASALTATSFSLAVKRNTNRPRQARAVLALARQRN